MLVGNNNRLQAIISQLEDTCRAVDESSRTQKSKLCEEFDHLYAILEERKIDMTLKINSEQEEKLDYIRGLKKKYSEHLDSMAKIVETGIETMEESEMAIFLQTAKPILQKITEGTNIAHLDKVEHGYENLDHYTANFERERRALQSVDFVKEDGDVNEVEEAAEFPVGRGFTGTEASHASGEAAVSPPKLLQQIPKHSPQTLSQRPTETENTNATGNESTSKHSSLTQPKLPALSQPQNLPQTQTVASNIPNLAQPSETAGQNENMEDKDGPKHVFSFSWLNHK